MPVAMMPGRTSYTPIPCAANRTANNLVVIDEAAFETQYSPRAIETARALLEVMLMIERWTAEEA